MNSEEITSTQTAWRFVAENRPNITKQTVPVPVPNDDEVLLKVLACGVCHSEFTLLDANNSQFDKLPPYTLGHEICGIVVKLGARATAINPTVELGGRYNVYSINACQSPDCYFCSIGEENMCDTAKGKGYGMGANGGFASYVNITARSLCRVPEGVTDGQACSATDACMTGHHAATCSGATKDSVVLCIGVGGVGSMAIQSVKNIVKAKTVIAVDSHESKLPAALALGADFAVLPDQLPGLLEKENLKVTVAIDCVGARATLLLAATSLQKLGRIQVVGIHSLDYTFSASLVMTKQLKIQGSYGGTLKDHCDCLAHVGTKLLTPSVEMGKMDDIVQALADLDAGKIKGRIALVP